MEEMTFEKALVQLEKIVSKMEKGQLKLEESLALYEQGVKLTVYCQRELDQAKLKIETLSAESPAASKDGEQSQ
jgi:exodeoxyribonuclease VII small subunit